MHTWTPSVCTCELDVKLVLRLEDLDVEGAVGGEVLHSPGPQDGLVVLGRRREGAWSVPAARALCGAGLCGVVGLCGGGAVCGLGCLWGRGPLALTAAVRSTSLRLLRMKQASPLSILQSTGLSAAWAHPQPVGAVGCGQRLGGEGRVETPPC